MNCFTCGHPIPVKKGRGRTREYCSDNCCNFNKYKNAMLKCMEIISFSTEMNKEIRRELFSLANKVKAGDKK